MRDTAELTANNRFASVDAETAQILKGRVSNNSRNCYESGNIKFLVWVYDNKEDHSRILKSSLLCTTETAYKTDRVRRARAGRPSKLHDALRAVCRSWLKETTLNDPETYTNDLEAFTFTMFACYLGTY